MNSEVNIADLTPIGAERDGNEAGTIPPWTGGITEPPVPYAPGDHHPDPFAGEQPLLRINAANMDEHRAFLSVGQIALLSTYPDYFMDIYTGHRTAAYPQRIYDMTAKNAATGRLSAGGNAVDNVTEGFPFPFPENGEELIWNHELRYKGDSSIRHIKMVAPTTNGSRLRRRTSTSGSSGIPASSGVSTASGRSQLADQCRHGRVGLVALALEPQLGFQDFGGEPPDALRWNPAGDGVGPIEAIGM